MQILHRGDGRWWRIVYAGMRGVGLGLLSLVLIYAGVVKATRPDLFAFDILSFDVVSWEAGVWIANVLPWVEILIGVGILIPTTRIPSLGCCVVLLLGFTALLAWTMMRGLEISCGCLGAGNGELTGAVWRNGVL
ncbi:MAG: MauE/DoxX family redox-associated membrane protein, partial [Chthoniobacterales bacterium]